MKTAHEKHLEELDKRFKEVFRTKESGLAFLVKAGIYTPTGKLTKNYRVTK